MFYFLKNGFTFQFLQNTLKCDVLSSGLLSLHTKAKKKNNNPVSCCKGKKIRVGRSEKHFILLIF
jgi:hypothetical protein